jgi:hypothetical protein
MAALGAILRFLPFLRQPIELADYQVQHSRVKRCLAPELSDYLATLDE